MLKAFPDYGKSPPEYVASLVQVMAEYPAHIQDRIADLRHGVPTKTEFLPTVKVITEFGDKLLQAEREAASYAARFSGKLIPGTDATVPYVPFPQLWNAFRDKPKLLQGKTFDALSEACKTLVLYGHDKARQRLLAKDTRGGIMDYADEARG